jgi:hypothetical protein
MIALRDLVVGFIENENYRLYPDVIANYYSKKLAVLKTLFACPLTVHYTGCTLDLDQISAVNANNVTFISNSARLAHLASEMPAWDEQEQKWFVACIFCAVIEKNPIRDLVPHCGVPSDLEVDYDKRFEGHTKALDELYIRLAAKILTMWFSGIEEKTFTIDDLVARGVAVTPPNIIEHTQLFSP